MRPARRRQLALWIHERFQVSKKRSCRLALLQRATFYYRSRAKDQSVLRMRIREPAHSRPRFGYERIHMIDKWSRESVVLETSFSLTGQSVVDALQQLSLSRPLPKAITVDHGTELTSIEDAKQRIEAWRQDYNHHRPHSCVRKPDQPQ